jgi:uncharacterized protein
MTAAIARNVRLFFYADGRGLETIESQFEIIAAIPEAQQIGMLKAVLFHADRAEDQMETMLQLYLGRQMDFAIPLQHGLAARFGVTPAAFAAFEIELLIKLHHGMVTAVRPLLDRGGAFVAVGALNLVGGDGIVALLRAAGYTLTAIE